MKGKKFDELIKGSRTLLSGLSRYSTLCPGLSLTVKRHGSSGYSYYSKSEEGLTYISKTDKALLKDLEQKEYCLLLSKTLENNIKILEKMKKLSEEIKDTSSVFSSVPRQRRHLIKPYVYESRELKKLIKDFGPGSPWDIQALKNDRFGRRNRPTESGYLVRSKTEEAFADCSFEKGLAFFYEMPLKLKTNHGLRTVYPDFTYYNVYTKTFICHEHFGMADNAEYAAENFPKLADYLSNGFVLNKNLFITLEGDNHPFTRKDVEKTVEMIKECLGPGK